MKPCLEGKKRILVCGCGYKTSKIGETTLKETISKESKLHIDVVEEEKTAHPLVDKECPKCGYKKAYFWEIQTRAADEPATQFFKCKKCKHTWRHYD